MFIFTPIENFPSDSTCELTRSHLHSRLAASNEVRYLCCKRGLALDFSMLEPLDTGSLFLAAASMETGANRDPRAMTSSAERGNYKAADIDHV